MINNILLYNSGGGLGDSLQLIPIINSLKNHYKSSNIYILGAHQNHFNNKLIDFGIKTVDYDLGLKYFGFRWWHFFKIKKNIEKKNLQKFDLIIDLQSKLRNTLILRKIPHKNFYSSTLNFHFCSKKNNYVKNPDIVLSTINNINLLLSENIKIAKFNFETIPTQFINEAKRLLPNNNYIGFSITQGNVYRKKSWLLNNFISLANKLETINKIPVFFIDKDHSDLVKKIKDSVPKAIFPEKETTHSSPVLVTALSKRLDKAISIDNGVMHMISLANVPMIVLFGPTNSDKFSPKISNIKVFDSKKIYGTPDINKITVQEIFESIK